MNPISVVPASVEVDGILRDGEISTFPSGNQWFTYRVTRARSYSIQVRWNSGWQVKQEPPTTESRS